MDGIKPTLSLVTIFRRTGKRQPLRAQIITKSISAVGPEQLRQAVDQGADACLPDTQCGFRAPALGDVNAGPHISQYLAVDIEARRGRFLEPPIGSIPTSQAILKPPRSAGVDAGLVFDLDAGQIVGVDTVEPTQTQLLLQIATGKGQPGLVEPAGFLVKAAHPDQNRCRIGNLTKPRLDDRALLQ